jgi:hypothetical protein
MRIISIPPDFFTNPIYNRWGFLFLVYSRILYIFVFVKIYIMKSISKVIDEVIEHDGVVYTRYEKHEDGVISIQWRVGGELVEYYRDDSGWVNGDCFDEDHSTPELEVMYDNKLR